MAEEIGKRPCSIGDLTAALDEIFEGDNEQSRALLPEVWNVIPKEAAGTKHAEERKRFLRLQILLELSMNSKQRQGLEPLGRIKIDYVGLIPI